MNTVKTNLPKLIKRTDAVPYPGKPKTYRFPKATLRRLRMTSHRANKLFRGEVNPTLDEINRLCRVYGFQVDEILTVKAS